MGKRTILILGLMLVLVITLVFVGGCGLLPGAEGEEGETGGLTGIWPMIIFIVLLFGMMYFVMIRPQRRRQKEHDEMVQELHRGDNVVTAGGIYGRVESVSDDSVVLKIESGVTIRIAKSSVSGKQLEPTERTGKIG